MAIIPTIRKIKCPLALCIIVSFALVYGCDILCNLGVTRFSMAMATVTSAAKGHQHETGHDHSGRANNNGNYDHHKAHDHGAKHDHGNTHDHESQKNNSECCDDITQQFYSSLVSSSGASLGSLIHAEAFKLISTFTLPDIFKVESFKGLQVVSTYDHHSNGPPDRKVGQRICILFCTFLI